MRLIDADKLRKSLEAEPCPGCGGTGTVQLKLMGDGSGWESDCPDCKGTGTLLGVVEEFLT